MEEAVKKQLERCIQLWNSTEKITKQAELISTALIRPSINELRYSGRWIVLALEAILKGKNEIDKLTTVENALSYAQLCCLQAKHDAIDSIVLYLHEKVDELNGRYGAHTISLYVQDYNHFLDEITLVDVAITTSREARETRVELYERIVSQHLPKLMDFLKRIRSAEVTINTALQDELAAEEKQAKEHAEVVGNLRTLLAGSQAETKRNKGYFHITLVISGVLLILAILPLLSKSSSITPQNANSSKVQCTAKDPHCRTHGSTTEHKN